MSKLYALIALFCGGFISNAFAQCETFFDPDLFVGDYYVYDITPDVLGFGTFNAAGVPTLVTLFSEVTDASQASPGVGLLPDFRAFDAVYLPDAGVGQPARTFAVQLNNFCEATFNTIKTIENDSGLTCSFGIRFGPASGGSWSPTDDSEFTLIFETNIFNDCGESAKEVELFFSREFLSADEFNVAAGFEHFITANKQLHIKSANINLQNVRISNLLGQELYNANVNATRLILDLETFKTGIYIVNLSTQNGETSFKILLR